MDAWPYDTSQHFQGRDLVVGARSSSQAVGDGLTEFVPFSQSVIGNLGHGIVQSADAALG